MHGIPGMSVMGMGGHPPPPLKKGQKRLMNGVPPGMMSGMGMGPGGPPPMDWRSMMAFQPSTGTSSGSATPPPPSR